MKLDRTVSTQETVDRVVLPAGVYKFEIRNCVLKMNRNNEPMWEVQMSFPEEKAARWVYDYITEKDSMAWKFNQIFDSVGADFAEDTSDMKNIIGDTGRVELSVEQSDIYGARNRVKKYIKDDSPKLDTGTKQVVKEEDLPF